MAFFSRRTLLAAAVLALLPATSVTARAEVNCVQFVEKSSRVSLHGDAWQWWNAAAGLYHRGRKPASGAVMIFSRSDNLPFGHVALVHRRIDRRTILVDHANWSPIDGRRGQIERAVAVVDVSPRNDWSRVRVWYHPAGELGQTVYPVKGFVYPRMHAPHQLR